jgi:antitoxin HigA-1
MPTPINRVPSHAGQILQTEFLSPRGITQSTLARELSVKAPPVNELVNGKRGITPQTAWMLARALGTSPEFWMNFQAA